jgi:hypothetical protein
MAVSALVSWAASRSAAVVVADPGLDRVVVGTVGTVGTGGTVIAIVVAVLSGATAGLTVDRPEHAATSRPAATRAMSP